MKAIILYDALSTGGSTDRIIDSIGEHLVKNGFYVEKAKTPPRADYSFLEEFDLVLLARRFTTCNFRQAFQARSIRAIF